MASLIKFFALILGLSILGLASASGHDMIITISGGPGAHVTDRSTYSGNWYESSDGGSTIIMELSHTEARGNGSFDFAGNNCSNFFIASYTLATSPYYTLEIEDKNKEPACFPERNISGHGNHFNLS